MKDSGDYISRKAAKKQMRNGRHSLEWLLASGAKTIGDSFEMILDEVPAADVRPVVNTCETCGYKTEQIRVKPYDGACFYWKLHSIKNEEWCCHWKQREES